MSIQRILMKLCWKEAQFTFRHRNLHFLCKFCVLLIFMNFEVSESTLNHVLRALEPSWMPGKLFGMTLNLFWELHFCDFRWKCRAKNLILKSYFVTSNIHRFGHLAVTRLTVYRRLRTGGTTQDNLPHWIEKLLKLILGLSPVEQTLFHDMTQVKSSNKIYIFDDNSKRMQNYHLEWSWKFWWFLMKKLTPKN